MYVTYFDEVKSQPSQGQNYYFVGGICVPMDKIMEIESQLNNLAIELFETADLTPETCFHARLIHFKKGPFGNMDFPERLAILKRLTEILANAPVKRVYVAIDYEKLKAKHKIAEIAFAHFCERVEMAMNQDERTILIGDLDNQEFKNMIADFARYRTKGTPWDWGIKITSIVDSVHFARSHHSRMIQLADIYLYTVSHLYGSRKGGFADAYSGVLKEFNLFPTRYKVWPLN